MSEIKLKIAERLLEVVDFNNEKLMEENRKLKDFIYRYCIEQNGNCYKKAKKILKINTD